jgi:ketosteroid isomerase-like protein
MTLQEISDRMELQELMVAYCYAVDRRDWDALDDIFTPDATIDYSEMVGFRGTLAETKQFLQQAMQQLAATQHIISTSQITIEGDLAHGRTVCTNPMVLHPNRHTMIVGLWYRDVFVRTARGWRIQSRYEERCWTLNTPEGLLAPEQG